jgi:hypothetical protein
MPTLICHHRAVAREVDDGGFALGTRSALHSSKRCYGCAVGPTTIAAALLALGIAACGGKVQGFGAPLDPVSPDAAVEQSTGSECEALGGRCVPWRSPCGNPGPQNCGIHPEAPFCCLP